MARPDYQGTLGFEMVTVTDADGIEDHLIREDGADDRHATVTERVLWTSLVETLAALEQAYEHINGGPGIKNGMAFHNMWEQCRRALKSNGWQS